MKSYILFILCSLSLILNIRFEFFLGRFILESRGGYDIGVYDPHSPWPSHIFPLPKPVAPVVPKPAVPKPAVPKPVVPNDPNLVPIVPKPVVSNNPKGVDINTSDSIREQVTDFYSQVDLNNQVDYLDIIQLSCII